MYKLLFPALSRQPQDYTPYKTAHDFIAELAFEVGYPLTIFITFGVLLLAFRLWIMKDYPQLAGLVMIFMDALVHFPDREIQAILIIIAFLAYVRARRHKHARHC